MAPSAAQVIANIPIAIPAACCAEQAPEDWWRALKESLAEAMAASGVRSDEISGIGLEKLGQWPQNPVSVGFQFCSLLWMRENQDTIAPA